MLERVGKAIAVGLLLTGCANSEVDPNPVQTVDIITQVPANTNFHERPDLLDPICGVALGELTLRQTHRRSEVIKNIPVEYLGFLRKSVFPEGSDPNNSCVNDRDGIIWTYYADVKLPPLPTVN